MSWLSTWGAKRLACKRLIQQQLDTAGLTSGMIAERAGVTKQMVSRTLNGHGHSQRVLNELRRAGVSEEYLFDPTKRNEQATR